MKPTNEQVRDWAIRCGDEWGSTLPEDKRFLAAVAALAYAAGAADMKERCAKEFDRRDGGFGIGFYDPHEPAEIIRALGDNDD